jgi:long-chain acyl-CoA synthetase
MMVEVSATPTTAAPPRTEGDHPANGTYGRVIAWLSKRVEVPLSQVDLTLPQYRVLGVLAEGSNASTALANRLAVRPPSVTALIDGLVARGLVDRKHEEGDRRRIALRLTDEGERIVAEADQLVDAYLTSIANCLPGPEEAAALHALSMWGQALSNFHQVKHAGGHE